MSTGKRAYDLLRGYVNREYDRIRGVELSSAEQELSHSLSGRMPPKTTSTASDPNSSTIPAGLTREERARKILGVEANADFDNIRRAFERLNKRSEPANFPASSAEREQAAQIQRHVQWAYGVLTEGLDGVEKRFRSLEID